MRGREVREARTGQDTALLPTSGSPLGGDASLTICLHEENQWMDLYFLFNGYNVLRIPISTPAPTDSKESINCLEVVTESGRFHRFL